MVSPECDWPPKEKGFLDIYSGSKGFAKAALRFGAPWVVCIDICDGAEFDVCDPETREAIEYLIADSAFEHVSAAPACASLSRAITPAVRSKAGPKGLPWVGGEMLEKIKAGTAFSLGCESHKTLHFAQSAFLGRKPSGVIFMVATRMEKPKALRSQPLFQG